MGFKQKAKLWKGYIYDLVDKPYAFVQNERVSDHTNGLNSL